MPATLTIRDETTSGDKLREWSLDFLTERITVRELIRSRVYQEVQDYNQRQPAEFRGLVQPTDAEQTLNGVKLKSPRQIDWKKQFYRWSSSRKSPGSLGESPTPRRSRGSTSSRTC